MESSPASSQPDAAAIYNVMANQLEALFSLSLSLSPCVRACVRVCVRACVCVCQFHTCRDICRGLDNRVYYMLAPGGEYYNYSGCGNTLNTNHPSVRRFFLDCLRYWVTEMHIDGFRFDLGSIMTRAHSLWQAEAPLPLRATTAYQGRP